MNAIELKDVNYRSNAFQLQDVSFNVPKGYVTGFIGGNGAENNNNTINYGFNSI